MFSLAAMAGHQEKDHKMHASLRIAAMFVSLTASTAAAAECVLPGAPELPEGRTSSEDQMVAGVRAVKAYQAELGLYRECIDGEIKALGEDAKKKVKAPLLALYDDSVDLEEALATRWNSQIRDYKAAQ